MFPGQGAQYSGMGKDLYDNYPLAKEIFNSIDQALGFDLSKKCFFASDEELKSTEIQQLAILAVSLAAYGVYKEKKERIDYLSGLSLGEYSCLYVAEVISLSDLVILVRERARAMQRAAENSPSTMFAVIGAERKLLEEKAKKTEFYIANINSTNQIVISLAKTMRQEVKDVLGNDGLRAIELGVSGGFHSPFMEEARQHLSKVIEGIDFKEAKTPILSNFTAKAHTKVDELKNNLIQQLVAPVLWNDCINFMIDKGVDLFYEIGPSRVLKGLMRKISPKTEVINLEKKDDFDKIGAKI